LNAVQNRPDGDTQDKKQVRRQSCGQHAGKLARHQDFRLRGSASLELPDAQAVIADQPVGSGNPCDQRSEKIENIKDFPGRSPWSETGEGRCGETAYSNNRQGMESKDPGIGQPRPATADHHPVFAEKDSGKAGHEGFPHS